MKIRYINLLPKLCISTRSLCQHTLAWGSLFISNPVWASTQEVALTLPLLKWRSSTAQQDISRSRISPERATLPPLSVNPSAASSKPELLTPAVGLVTPTTDRNGATKKINAIASGSKLAKTDQGQKQKSISNAVSFKLDIARPPRSYKASTLADLKPARLEPASDQWFNPDFQLAAENSIAQENDSGIVRDEPNLRNLQVQAPSSNLLEPGNVSPQRPNCPNFDPDLGCIYIDGLVAPPPPPPKSVFLIFRADYFRISNVFSGVDPIDDGLFRPGVTLYAAPRLGPNTFLIAAANGNLIRYSREKIYNYNELAFDVGVFQQLSPNMSAKFGWVNQQLFIASNDLVGFSKGQRFLDDHAIRFELNRRDQLSNRLALTTYYQFRLGFADPADRSRVINSIIASLTYDLQPSILQLGLDYQFALATFTQQKREDQYQQIGLRLTYNAFSTTQVNLFAGYSFGRSSDPLVNFDGLVFGITLVTSLALF